MENPNEFNDGEWSRWSVELDSAIQTFWGAGATVEEIEEAVENAFGNLGLSVEVTIDVREPEPKPKQKLKPKPESK